MPKALSPRDSKPFAVGNVLSLDTTDVNSSLSSTVPGGKSRPDDRPCLHQRHYTAILFEKDPKQFWTIFVSIQTKNSIAVGDGGDGT